MVWKCCTPSYKKIIFIPLLSPLQLYDCKHRHLSDYNKDRRDDKIQPKYLHIFSCFSKKIIIHDLLFHFNLDKNVNWCLNLRPNLKFLNSISEPPKTGSNWAPAQISKHWIQFQMEPTMFYLRFFYHKLKFSNPFLFVTLCCVPLIFQTMNFVR